MQEICHIPVLAKEVIDFLDPKPGRSFIDGTVGQGGHAQLLLERVIPGGRLLAIDQDMENLVMAKKRLAAYATQVVFLHDSYANIKQLAYAHDFSQVDGIFLDLGFSSAHLQNAKRGFSFQMEGPLDMRYNQDQQLTAREILSGWTKQELQELFLVYGEELRAENIAQAIVQRRKISPLQTTTELADLVCSVVPKRGKIHPATRIFQALRIAVNSELEQLKQVLPQTLDLLKPEGRLAIISFHSLEDRIVKRFFKDHQGKELSILTKKVIVPTTEEQKENPRCRSAKLRVAEKHLFSP